MGCVSTLWQHAAERAFLSAVGRSLHECLRQREAIPDALLRCRLRQLNSLGDSSLAATLMCVEASEDVLGGTPHASTLT